MTTLCSIAVADGEDYDDDDGDDHDVDGLEKYQQAMLYIYIYSLIINIGRTAPKFVWNLENLCPLNRWLFSFPIKRFKVSEVYSQGIYGSG